VLDRVAVWWLRQIDTTNVKQLKGAWMTRLKGSGFGGKYSAEATPLVKDGIMYMVTGNDDVFALNAKTGEIQWERYASTHRSGVGRSGSKPLEHPPRALGLCRGTHPISTPNSTDCRSAFQGVLGEGTINQRLEIRDPRSVSYAIFPPTIAGLFALYFVADLHCNPAEIRVCHHLLTFGYCRAGLPGTRR
jgi:hypothetical protein